MASRTHALTVVDRTTIGLRLTGGWGIRRIARGRSRSAGTISDEVSRNERRAIKIRVFLSTDALLRLVTA